MNYKLILLIIGIALLSIPIYFSYNYFAQNAAYESPSVQGSSQISAEQNNYSIPLPTDSQELGRNQTENFLTLTMETNLTPTQTQTFYSNVLTNREWELVSKGKQDIFQVSRYTNSNGDNLKITASTQIPSVENPDEDVKTIVTIELQIAN